MRSWLIGIASALLAAAVQAVGWPERAIAAGENDRGHFVFSGWEGPALRVWYQLPEQVRAETPVVIVMHGVNRDADRYRDEWSDLARHHGFIVVVPEFGATDFPGSRSYNTGYFTNPDGSLRPRKLWSFAAIEPLFDEVRQRFGTAVPRYTIFGHSAGAQFVHRYVMFMPEARIEQAVAANAGWYTMPELATEFPYGLAGAPVNEGSLRAALGKPLTVLLGTADTDLLDPDLRKTPEANRQGPHRYARGLQFFRQGQASAARMGIPFGWRLETVADIGHSNGRMANYAAQLIIAR